ncbi:MAG: hypothetical protein ACM3N4_05810, partial [Nitrososphaerota archaeon]
GWRRTSLAAISALFVFILARFTVRDRPALPASTLPADSDEDVLDRQIRLRMPVTVVSAPSDFTARVLARIETAPAPHPQRARAIRFSWLRSLRVIAATLTVALLLMLATGVVVTLVNPNLAVAILDAVISVAIGLLAFARMIGHLIARAAATPWMIPAALGGLLGFLLLSWAQLARQFGRDPQEA